MILPPVTATVDQIAALRAKHKDIPRYGAMGYRFTPLVRDFAREISAKTAIDYACGKGMLADELVRLGALTSVHKYEIGIEGCDVPLAAPVDLAICNHAFYEFNPEHFVASLRYLREVSTHGAFISFQWSGEHQGGQHWQGRMQDADWTYATLRQFWPCHRVLDSGPLNPPTGHRQFVFMGFVKVPRWL